MPARYCTNQKSSVACDLATGGSWVANAGQTGFIGVNGAEVEDVTAYGRYLNNPNNGIVYYLPGTQIHQHTSELRMLLDSVLATPLGTVTQIVPTTTDW